MLQRPDPSVNPDRSPRTALGHADVQDELGRLRPADLGDLRSRLDERPLRPLIAEYTAIFGSTWRPATRRKHRDDFGRFVRWLEDHDRPITTGSFDFATLVEFVDELRTRPKVAGVWRGDLGATERSRAVGHSQTLSANSVNTYVRPLRSLAIWLVEEGIVATNPFSRSRRRRGLNPLLPSEETPTKGASIADLAALERGCAGDDPLALRDQAIVALLKTTAARNSSVRLLRVGDVDFTRGLVRFHRAKGGKTLDVSLHPEAHTTVLRYLAHGRPLMPGVVPAAVGPDEILFLSHQGLWPLSMNALSLMLTRRYRVGGGSLPYFGSHRIRHGVATLMVNNGMPLDEVSRYLGHSSTAPTRRYAVHTADTLGHRAAEALERAGLVSA
jgi:integrase/recombinase XerD